MNKRKYPEKQEDKEIVVSQKIKSIQWEKKGQ